ncbi:hypothetical protein ACN28S_39930 [Cystobacter fuscus]
MRDYSLLRPLLLLAFVSGTACTNGGKPTPGVADGLAADAPPAFPCVHFETLQRFLPEALEGLPAPGTRAPRGATATCPSARPSAATRAERSAR